MAPDDGRARDAERHLYSAHEGRARVAEPRYPEASISASMTWRSLSRRAPGSRHLPNGRLLVPDCTLTWSRMHRPAHPKPPDRNEWPRFRSMLDCATVFGGWEESSGKSQFIEMIEVSELTDPSSLTELKDDWDALIETCPDDLPFVTSQFLLPWINMASGNLRCRTLTARENGRLIGIAPIFERRFRKFGMTCITQGFPMHGTTPPLDFITGDHRRAVIRAFVDHWRKAGDWDFLWLHKVPSESSTIPILQDVVARTGFGIRTRESEHTLVVRITGCWDDYFASLSQNIRSNVRRRWRMCAKWGTAQFLRYPGEVDRLDTALDMAFQVIAKSWKKFDGARSKTQREFFTRCARALDEKNWLSLRFLLIEDAPVAYLFEIEYRGNSFLFHGAYDAAYQIVSPGQLVCSDVLRAGHERGFGRVELGGSQDYLSRWANDRRSFTDVCLINQSYLSRIKERIYFYVHDRRYRTARSETARRKDASKRAPRKD